jgi:hypothetical protein
MRMIRPKSCRFAAGPFVIRASSQSQSITSSGIESNEARSHRQFPKRAPLVLRLAGLHPWQGPASATRIQRRFCTR